MAVDTLSEMLSKRPLRLLQGALAEDEMHICRIATHISSSLFTLLAPEPGNSWPIIAGIFWHFVVSCTHNSLGHELCHSVLSSSCRL